MWCGTIVGPLGLRPSLGPWRSDAARDLSSTCTRGREPRSPSSPVFPLFVLRKTVLSRGWLRPHGCRRLISGRRRRVASGRRHRVASGRLRRRVATGRCHHLLLLLSLTFSSFPLSFQSAVAGCRQQTWWPREDGGGGWLGW